MTPRPRLLLASALACAPMALVAVLVFLQSSREQQAQASAAVQAAVQAMSASVDAELDKSLDALASLAASPRLAADDLPAFHAEAVNQVRRRADWSNVVLSTPAAEQRMNTLLPLGAALPSRVTPGLVGEVAAGGRPVVGGMIFSRLLQAHAFAVYQPVVRNDRVVAVLSAVVRPAAILDAVLRHELPPRGVAAVVDRQGLIVARSVDPLGSLGQPATAALQQRLAQPGSPPSVVTSREGLRMLAAVHRSPRTGWSVVLGVPVQERQAGGAARQAQLAGACMVALAVGLYAAWRTVRPVVSDIELLSSATEALAQAHPLPAGPARSAWASRHLAALRRLQARLRPEAAGPPAAPPSPSRAPRDGTAPRPAEDPAQLLGAALGEPLTLLLLRDSSPAHGGLAEPGQRQPLRWLARRTTALLSLLGSEAAATALPLQPVELAGCIREAMVHARPPSQPTAAMADLPACWVTASPALLPLLLDELLEAVVRATGMLPALALESRPQQALAVLRLQAAAPDAAQADAGSLPDDSLLRLAGLLAVRSGCRLHTERPAAGTGLALSLHCSLADPPPWPWDGTPAASLPAGPAAARRILILSASPELRSSLQDFLRGEGHQVQWQAPSAAGLETVRAVELDVAIVDGSGANDAGGLARGLRERAPETLVLIALSPSGSPAARARSMRAGFDRHLAHPVTPEALRAALAVGGRRA